MVAYFLINAVVPSIQIKKGDFKVDVDFSKEFEGAIGIMPVFDNFDKAHKYAGTGATFIRLEVQ